MRASGGMARPIAVGRRHAGMSKTVQTSATLAVAACALLATAGHAGAATEVLVGGSYHDEAFRAAHRDLVRGSMESAGQVTVGGIRINVEAGEASAITGFTPRFAGLGRGLGAADRGTETDHGSELKTRLDLHDEAPVRRELRIGPDGSAEIAGIEFDWSAVAGIENTSSSAAAGDSAFVLGGEMAVSGFRFDATYGQDPGLLGIDGNRVTAGLAYDFGGLDARVSYSLVDTDAPEEASLLTLGSQLTLRPGIVLQGDVAYADEGESGAGTTAGRVGLRLNF